MSATIRVKTSLGIWALGPNATRFVPGGYHPEAATESMVDRTRRAVDGLGDLMDSYEYHYPTEINEQTLPAIQAALGDKDIYCLALGLFSNPRYALGSFVNPKAELRRETVQIARAGIDLAAAIGARFIIWPGAEGYNYNFQADGATQWRWFLEGLGEVCSHAHGKGVVVFLEHKNSEPAMKILMRDIGMKLFVIHKLERDYGLPRGAVQVNMDWQHLIMNGEPLPEYASLLAAEGLLGHQHGNSGWGSFDDDNMVGASFFMETLALAQVLQDVGYGGKGERVGFDLYPYTEDQVESVRQSILAWEFIDSIARRIDRAELRAAQADKDAVRAQRAVFQALGLDQQFIDRVYASRRK